MRCVVLSDNQLLQRFVEFKSNSAFGELVQRHISMVYASALRKTLGNSALAEDVAQQVFIDLSMKAGTLVHHTSVASWLYRSTCFAAAKALRGASRERAKIEANALLMEPHQLENSAEWEVLAPHLDDAMEGLPEPDRQAVLLRFFENRSFREVGAELGVSEEAARKRVARAVERLRDCFATHGLTTTSATLTSGLAACLLVPAPPALAAVICHAAVVAASSPAIASVALFTMTKIQAGVAALFLTAAVTTTVVQYKNNVRLKEAVVMREHQVVAALAPLSNDAAPEPMVQPQPSAPLQNPNELFRLRGEVTALRRRLREMNSALTSAEENEALRQRFGGQNLRFETIPGSPFAPNRYYPNHLWSDVGLDSPEATLQTAIAAIKSGEVDRLMDAIHWPTNRAEEGRNLLISRISAKGTEKFPGAEAAGLKVESFGGNLKSSEIHYVVVMDHGQHQRPVRTHFFLHNVNGNWRLVRIIGEVGERSEDFLLPQ